MTGQSLREALGEALGKWQYSDGKGLRGFYEDVERLYGAPVPEFAAHPAEPAPANGRDVSPSELFDELKKANLRAVEAEAELERLRSAPVGVEITDEAVEAVAEVEFGFGWEQEGKDVKAWCRDLARAALEAARPFMTSRPALDRAITEEMVEAAAKAVYADPDNLNKVPWGQALCSVQDVYRHHSRLALAAVMALAVPVPTREQIAEALHRDSHDLGGAACRKHWEGELITCYERSLSHADAVLALLNGSAK